MEVFQVLREKRKESVKSAPQVLAARQFVLLWNSDRLDSQVTSNWRMKIPEVRDRRDEDKTHTQ